MSRETVYLYLSFLQGTYFIFLVPPVSRNVDREVSGTKKVYLSDTGLINLFGKVSDGRLLENALFQNLRHYGRVHYYQKRSGAEVNFILPDEMMAFEVKKRAREQDYRKLKRTSQSLNMKEWYVISQDFSADRGIVLAQDL
ncbi:MAG: DUF4143 domain-containing protein [bacterium]